MSGISGRHAIAGIGESDVGRSLGRAASALHVEAAVRALNDAGLKNTDIDAVLARSSRSEQQLNYSAVLAGMMGIRPTFISDVGLGGASSAAMILQAVAAIET